MELVNSKGRFDFIRNSQVMIDEKLPKYEIINNIYQGKLKQLETSFVGNIKTAMDSIERQLGELNNSDDVEGEEVLVSNIDNVPTYDDLRRPDKIARDILSSFDNVSIRLVDSCIQNNNADIINEFFADLLHAERTSNKDSINVTSGRVIPYSENQIPEEIDVKRLRIVDKLRFLLNPKTTKVSIENAERKRMRCSLKDELLKLYDFFNKEIMEERKITDKIAALSSMIDGAMKMHQTAQLDDICKSLILNIYEILLSKNGYMHYVAFDRIESFDCFTRSMMEIRYVENVKLPIPKSVIDKRVECDSFHIFDNYCVVYYAPKDIKDDVGDCCRRCFLFGLINHSPKLYFIDEWNDEMYGKNIEQVSEIMTINNLNKK